MTTKTEIQAAEHRGYAKGYSAALRRQKKERTAAHVQRERQAFLDRAYLAVLPAVVSSSGWKTGNEPISGIPGRVGLAVDFSVEALRRRPFA